MALAVNPLGVPPSFYSGGAMAAGELALAGAMSSLRSVDPEDAAAHARKVREESRASKSKRQASGGLLEHFSTACLSLSLSLSPDTSRALGASSSSSCVFSSNKQKTSKSCAGMEVSLATINCFGSFSVPVQSSGRIPFNFERG